MNDNQKTAGIYIRVSSDEQSKGGVSLEAQENRLREYCRGKGFNIHEPIFLESEGVSGYFVPLARRPQGKLLVEAVHTGNVKHVVAVKMDRLFRRTVDALTTIQEWDDDGISLHLVDFGGQAMDTRSAMGRVFIGFLAVLAQWYRDVTSEATCSALKHKHRNGEKTGGDIPYGMESFSDGEMRWNKKTGTELPVKKLRVNLAEQAIIATIRSQAGSASHRQIAANLNIAGLSGRAGRCWSPKMVGRVLARNQQRTEKP